MLYAPLLIWIGVILILGSSQGSMTRTSLIIRPILEFLFPTAPEETLQFYHGMIRKLAHLTEYAVLALFACRAFVRLSRSSFRRRFYVLAGLLVLTVAGTDEFIQSFNPERTSSSVDVLIDLLGGVAAIGIYYLFFAKRLSVKQTQ
jgi:VanZ family protein